MSVLSANIYICSHIHAWCLWIPEQGIRSLGIQVPSVSSSSQCWGIPKPDRAAFTASGVSLTEAGESSVRV